MSPTPESMIWLCDSGQRISCSDSCQIDHDVHVQDHASMPAMLCEVAIRTDVGRTLPLAVMNIKKRIIFSYFGACMILLFLWLWDSTITHTHIHTQFITLHRQMTNAQNVSFLKFSTVGMVYFSVTNFPLITNKLTRFQANQAYLFVTSCILIQNILPWYGEKVMYNYTIFHTVVYNKPFRFNRYALFSKYCITSTFKQI